MSQPVFIAHNYPLDRISLSQIVKQTLFEPVIIETGNYEKVSKYLDEANHFPILILDLDVIPEDKKNNINSIFMKYPKLTVLAVSNTSCESLSLELKKLGISGCISKKDSAATVSKAIKKLDQDKQWFPNIGLTSKHSSASPINILSKQELNVLIEMNKGLMNKQIAAQLSISVHTAKVHVSTILKKLRVQTRTQAVLLYRQEGSEAKEPMNKSNEPLAYRAIRNQDNDYRLVNAEFWLL